MSEHAPEFQAFCDALKTFCLSHGYEIAGTYKNSGQYGEIEVLKIGHDHGGDQWSKKQWDINKFNFELGE